jgi:hypothetical protein
VVEEERSRFELPSDDRTMQRRHLPIVTSIHDVTGSESLPEGRDISQLGSAMKHNCAGTGVWCPWASDLGQGSFMWVHGRQHGTHRR